MGIGAAFDYYLAAILALLRAISLCSIIKWPMKLRSNIFVLVIYCTVETASWGWNILKRYNEALDVEYRGSVSSSFFDLGQKINVKNEKILFAQFHQKKDTFS